MITKEEYNILKEKNIPYIKKEWEYIEKIEAKEPLKKYLVLMKLPAFRKMNFKDGQFLYF